MLINTGVGSVFVIFRTFEIVSPGLADNSKVSGDNETAWAIPVDCVSKAKNVATKMVVSVLVSLMLVDYMSI